MGDIAVNQSSLDRKCWNVQRQKKSFWILMSDPRRFTAGTFFTKHEWRLVTTTYIISAYIIHRIYMYNYFWSWVCCSIYLVDVYYSQNHVTWKWYLIFITFVMEVYITGGSFTTWFTYVLCLLDLMSTNNVRIFLGSQLIVLLLMPAHNC